MGGTRTSYARLHLGDHGWSISRDGTSMGGAMIFLHHELGMNRRIGLGSTCPANIRDLREHLVGAGTFPVFHTHFRSDAGYLSRHVFIALLESMNQTLPVMPISSYSLRGAISDIGPTNFTFLVPRTLNAFQSSAAIASFRMRDNRRIIGCCMYLQETSDN